MFINSRNDQWKISEKHFTVEGKALNDSNFSVKLRKDKRTLRKIENIKNQLPDDVFHSIILGIEKCNNQCLDILKFISSTVQKYDPEKIFKVLSKAIPENFLQNLTNYVVVNPQHKRKILKHLCRIFENATLVFFNYTDLSFISFLLDCLSDSINYINNNLEQDDYNESILFLGLTCIGNLTKCENFIKSIENALPINNFLYFLLNFDLQYISNILPIFFTVCDLNIQLDDDLYLQISEWLFFYISDEVLIGIRKGEFLINSNVELCLFYSFEGLSVILRKMIRKHELLERVNPDQLFNILISSIEFNKNVTDYCLTFIKSILQVSNRYFPSFFYMDKVNALIELCKDQRIELVKLSISCLNYSHFTNLNSFKCFIEKFLIEIVFEYGIKYSNFLQFSILLRSLIFLIYSNNDLKSEIIEKDLKNITKIIETLTAILSARSPDCIMNSLSALEIIFQSSASESIPIFFDFSGKTLISNLVSYKNPLISMKCEEILSEYLD